MTSCSTTPFAVNGRTYAPPDRTVVVICLDGSADDYFDAALARDRMPNLKRMCVTGYRGFARSAMPSFTNVNNSSIVTGVPPSVHGIGGNFFFDVNKGEEVMMNSATYLRAETIFPAAARTGRKVAVITAKEKLRDIFASGLIGPNGGIAFSSEKANLARAESHGISAVEELVGRATPPIYSAEASLFVLQAGVALLEKGLADFVYLSTTDYMQHKFPPTAAESIDFYAAIDREIGRLLEGGAVLGLTADHGMNAKQNTDGSPKVIYLETLLSKQFGRGFRVILPITDPYVKHHGALGSFAQVHLPPDAAARFSLQDVIAFLLRQPGITEAHDRATAARLLELPPDRMGDLVVCSGRDVVLGRTSEHHDLSQLEAPLRSHGGRYEEMVPFMFSAPLTSAYAARAAGDARNFDVFDFAINGLQPGPSSTS
jgi:phosphonoacetate hydrolase